MFTSSLHSHNSKSGNISGKIRYCASLCYFDLLFKKTEIGWLNTALAELRETKGKTAGRQRLQLLGGLRGQEASLFSPQSIFLSSSQGLDKRLLACGATELADYQPWQQRHLENSKVSPHIFLETSFFAQFIGIFQPNDFSIIFGKSFFLWAPGKLPFF